MKSGKNKLVDAAIEAITRVFSDQSVTPEESLARMEAIEDEIHVMEDALREQIRNQMRKEDGES